MRRFLLLMFIPGCCFAQKEKNEKDLFLKVNLVSLVDQFSFPTLRLSLEKKITKDISIAGEFGYQLYAFKRVGNDTSFVHPHGTKTNIEFRYYDLLNKLHLFPSRIPDLAGIYIGVNFFYNHNRYNTNISYIKPNDPTPRRDCFWVEKTVNGANMELGYQTKISNRWILEAFGGLGAMNRDIKNHNREYTKGVDIAKESIDLNIPAILDDVSLSETSGPSVYFTVGLRLGIKL